MIALLAAAAVNLAAAHQASIRTAEGAVADILKDPFSVRFMHVIVSVGTRSAGTNVCGFAYAKNSAGVYNGRIPFVVGLKDGSVIGLMWGEDNDATATFGDDWNSLCDVPFLKLQAARLKHDTDEQTARDQQEAANRAASRAIMDALQAKLQNDACHLNPALSCSTDARPDARPMAGPP